MDYKNIRKQQTNFYAEVIKRMRMKHELDYRFVSARGWANKAL